jgi:hypothetical protein
VLSDRRSAQVRARSAGLSSDSKRALQLLVPFKKADRVTLSAIQPSERPHRRLARLGRRLIDLGTTLLVLLQQFEPVRDIDKYGVGKDIQSRERILHATQLRPPNQADWRALESMLSES